MKPIESLVLTPQTAHVVHLSFEWLALLVGVQYYRILKLRSGQGALFAKNNFPVVLGCILGAAIGNKAVFWIEYAYRFREYATTPMAWLMGQSLVGGLLGGLIGVEIAKKMKGTRESTGDLFVFPILLGIMVGRVGCFLAGLNDGTFGVATALPWGIDFGDGVARHPTQLYEIVFAALLWLVLRRIQPLVAQQSGLLFKLFLSSYLMWRLAVDGLKPVPQDFGFGLSGIQVVCLFALAVYLPSLVAALFQWRAFGQQNIQGE